MPPLPDGCRLCSPVKRCEWTESARFSSDVILLIRPDPCSKENPLSSLWKEAAVRAAAPRRPAHLLHVLAAAAAVAQEVGVQAEDGLGGLTVEGEAALGEAEPVLAVHSAPSKHTFSTGPASLRLRPPSASHLLSSCCMKLSERAPRYMTASCP